MAIITPSGSSPSEEEEVVASAEEEAVGAWRLLCLMIAGYEPGKAELLAGSPDVDLNMARDLPARGCSHDLAFEILL